MTFMQMQDSSIDSIEESAWIIRPHNVDTIAMPPISMMIELKSTVTDELLPVGGFEIVNPRSRRHLDYIMHKTLLEQSMQEYSSIWTTLAQR